MKNLLKNPDRGFRTEHYITLGEPLQSYPGDNCCPFEKLRRIDEKYRADSPVVVQLYVYLPHYRKKPLDALAFSQLERILNLCVELEIQALLRFAYQNEVHCVDPKYRVVKGHLGQLEAWFAANEKLVTKSVTAVQGGLIGLWGEGHSNVKLRPRHFGKIYNRLAKMIPPTVFLQVRTRALADAVDREFLPRLGMHDDYIIGDKNCGWSYYFGHAGTDDERFTMTLNDAEMPWGRATMMDKPDGEGLYNMPFLPILRQVKQYSLSTFSLEHNYLDFDPGDGEFSSLARWKKQFITIEMCEQEGFPYLPALFNGGRMTVFDYIKYHLGYLLSVKVEADRFTIKNHGFAPPLNARLLVVNGNEVSNFDPYKLGSMQQVKYSFSDINGGFNAAAACGLPDIKLFSLSGREIYFAKG